MSNESAHVELRILSQSRYLCVVRAAVEATAGRWGLDEQTCGRIVLAVDEAVANVIRHGYKHSEDQPIWIRLAPLEQSGGGMEIVIEDRCPNVDLSRIKARSLDEVRPGGLGINILQQVMDEVKFEHVANGEGVRLTMRKRATSDA